MLKTKVHSKVNNQLYAIDFVQSKKERNKLSAVSDSEITSKKRFDNKFLKGSYLRKHSCSLIVGKAGGEGVC